MSFADSMQDLENTNTHSEIQIDKDRPNWFARLLQSLLSPNKGRETTVSHSTTPTPL
ncbi:hypothetical protein [Pseudomonas sp. Marseille-QA0892]